MNKEKWALRREQRGDREIMSEPNWNQVHRDRLKEAKEKRTQSKYQTQNYMQQRGDLVELKMRVR